MRASAAVRVAGCFAVVGFNELKPVGLHPVSLGMSEFIKSGGAVRCLTLPLWSEYSGNALVSVVA